MLSSLARRAPSHRTVTQIRQAYSLRFTSTNSKAETSKDQAKPSENSSKDSQSPPPQKKPRKTQAQLDEELRLKMAGLSGDGGESGIEYEDGQPVSMKRGVKNNMFRYI